MMGYATKSDLEELRNDMRELRRLAFKNGFLAAAAVYKPFEWPSTVDKREEAAWQESMQRSSQH